MLKTFLASILAATTIAGAACAQSDAPQPTMYRGGGGMMRADTNHDGIVTRQEAAAEADQRFAGMDANRDGRIDAQEMAAHRSAMAERRAQNAASRGGMRHAPGMGRRADPDGDGTISHDEFRARAMTRFDRVDTNHDGRIDRTDMANLREMRQVRRQERQGGMQQPTEGDDGQ